MDGADGGDPGEAGVVFADRSQFLISGWVLWGLAGLFGGAGRFPGRVFVQNCARISGKRHGEVRVAPGSRADLGWPGRNVSTGFCGTKPIFDKP